MTTSADEVRFDQEHSMVREQFSSYFVTAEWNEDDPASSGVYVTLNAPAELEGEFIRRVDAR